MFNDMKPAANVIVCCMFALFVSIRGCMGQTTMPTHASLNDVIKDVYVDPVIGVDVAACGNVTLPCKSLQKAAVNCPANIRLAPGRY
jgi:hypothetical protein